jgi:hypothetical protein
MMRRFVSLLAVGLLVAGCGGSGSAARGSPSAPAGSRHYDLATSSTGLVFQVDEDSGFPPPASYVYTRLPLLSLYGDGRIIHPGDVDGRMSFPGRDSTRPLLPDPWLVRVTPDEIQRIVAAADEAGLLGPDAGYRITLAEEFEGFTLVVDGQTHHTVANGLYGGGPADDPTLEATRNRLVAFDGKIDDLEKFLGRSLPREAYVPTAMRLYVGAADATAGGDERDWPLAVDPATAGEPTTYLDLHLRCLVVSGADLDAFLAVARTASEATVWKAASGRYSLMARPLLPDESGCGTL